MKSFLMFTNIRSTYNIRNIILCRPVYFIRGAAGEQQEQGTFGLPAQELDGAFIEFKVLRKELRPLPSFAQLLRKREREPDQTAFTLMQQAQQSQQNVVKDLVETLKSEEVKSKISLCPGLRIVEDTSDIWHPFQIYTWTNMFAATATDAQKSATSMAWKVELHQSLTDAGVTVSQSTNVYDLRAYNEARDQYSRWLVLSDLTPLKTKEQWTFGFMHLFHLCGRSCHTQVRLTTGRPTSTRVDHRISEIGCDRRRCGRTQPCFSGPTRRAVSRIQQASLSTTHTRITGQSLGNRQPSI